jgi:putative SOS response-associated peptidase YedK
VFPGPKSAPVDGQHELFGFLTTEPNAVVAAIHPKAMPVILRTPAEVDLWLLADAPKALELQRPLPDDALRIVSRAVKRRMVRARMPCSTGIKTQCSCFDALRGFQPYHTSV